MFRFHSQGSLSIFGLSNSYHMKTFILSLFLLIPLSLISQNKQQFYGVTFIEFEYMAYWGDRAIPKFKSSGIKPLSGDVLSNDSVLIFNFSNGDKILGKIERCGESKFNYSLVNGSKGMVFHKTLPDLKKTIEFDFGEMTREGVTFYRWTMIFWLN